MSTAVGISPAIPYNMALSIGGAGGGGAIAYLLRATYTSSKMAEDGTITYTETDGSIAQSGSSADVTAQSAAAWGDLGWDSQDTNSAAGYGFGFTLNGSAIATTQLYAGWNDGTGLAITDFMNAIHIDGSGNIDTVVNGAAGVTGIGTVTNSTDEKFFIVTGGYNASGVPLDASANIASYAYGSAYFQNTGTNWILLYPTTDVLNTAQDFAAMSFFDYGGTYDYPIVPDADLSSVLEPIVLDTFTDTNGTLLTAHTPDVDTVGTGWSAAGGTWEIQGNKCEIGTDSGDPEFYIASGKSDVLVELVLNKSATTSSCGITFRRTSASALWYIQAQTSGSLRILEFNSGVTVRGIVAATINTATDYRMVAISDGATISAYFDDSVSLSYASATFNETETVHGVIASVDEQTIDNFAIYARGTGGEYAVLDSY